MKCTLVQMARSDGTTQPVWTSFNSNSGPTKFITPDIIPASNPKRNPPNETVNDKNKTLLFIVAVICKINNIYGEISLYNF